MPTLNVPMTTNYSIPPANAQVTGQNITDIVFTGPSTATATFSATQFGGANISNTVAISGNAQTNIVSVGGSTINASGWTFTNWTNGVDKINLTGTGGDDAITGSSQNDNIFGGFGRDLLFGGGGDDLFEYFLGGEADDAEVIDGQDGVDRIVVGPFLDLNLSVAVIQNVEQLSLRANTVTIMGGTQIGAGAITMVFGDSGTQSLNVRGSAVNLANVAFNDWTADDDVITITGTSASSNQLVGSSQNDTIGGSAESSDTMTGGGGGDTLNGGGGVDIFRYVAAVDIAAGETINGASGTDLIALIDAGAIDFTPATVSSIEAIDFVSGATTASFDAAQIADVIAMSGSDGVDGLVITGSSTNIVTWNISSWTAGVDTITLNGTVGDDFLVGSLHGDSVLGGDGSDVLIAYSGADSLNGGAGNDHLYGGEEADVIVGGDGFDFTRYDGSPSGVTVRLDVHAGFSGAAEGDTIAADIEGVVGSIFADILVGDAADNQIFGGGMDDFLYGQGGVDALFGDLGSDVLYGGADLDLLVGGAAADLFFIDQADLAPNVFDYIFDFEDGVDFVVLEAWSPASLFMFESGGHVFITSADFGFASGAIVLNATVAQVQDQFLIL